MVEYQSPEGRNKRRKRGRREKGMYDQFGGNLGRALQKEKKIREAV